MSSCDVDWDGAADAKDKAVSSKAAGDFDGAIAHYTRALELGSVSAIALANRAECLILAKRPVAAISDCSAALSINPDSAKAFRYTFKNNTIKRSNLNLYAIVL